MDWFERLITGIRGLTTTLSLPSFYLTYKNISKFTSSQYYPLVGYLAMLQKSLFYSPNEKISTVTIIKIVSCFYIELFYIHMKHTYINIYNI